MKKSDIKNQAEKLMKDHPSVDTVYATSDGQLFTGKNSAELHRDTNAKKAKLEIFTFGAAEAFDTAPVIEPPLKPHQHNVDEVSIPEFDGLSSEELIGKIATVEDPTVLTVLQSSEEKGENRATVLEAIGQRNAQLVAALPLKKSESSTEEITAASVKKDLSEKNNASITDLNAPDAIAKVKEITDVKQLDALEAAENKGDARKTVLAAIGKQNAHLTDAAKTDQKRKEDDK